MMEHYDISEFPMRYGVVKWTGQAKWDDSIKSTLAWKEARNHQGRPYKDYTTAICGCCGEDYAYLPSELNHIINNGYCAWCSLYRDKKVAYIYGSRMATYDEVYKKYKDAELNADFSISEVRILMKGKE